MILIHLIIVSNVFTVAANKRMRELEEIQSELDRLIIIERSKMQVKVSAEEIRNFYEAALMQEPQMLINCLVKEIIVYDDEIQIYSIAHYRRVLTKVRAFLYETGKQRYKYTYKIRLKLD